MHRTSWQRVVASISVGLLTGMGQAHGQSPVVTEFTPPGFNSSLMASSARNGCLVVGGTFAPIGPAPGGQTLHGGPADGLVIAYDATTGPTVWTRLIGTPGNDQISPLTTDAAGNVYVGGIVDGAFGGFTNAGTFPGTFDAFGEAEPGGRHTLDSADWLRRSTRNPAR